MYGGFVFFYGHLSSAVKCWLPKVYSRISRDIFVLMYNFTTTGSTVVWTNWFSLFLFFKSILIFITTIYKLIREQLNWIIKHTFSSNKIILCHFHVLGQIPTTPQSHTPRSIHLTPTHWRVSLAQKFISNCFDWNPKENRSSWSRYHRGSHGKCLCNLYVNNDERCLCVLETKLFIYVYAVWALCF